jgi:2Fe-2S ferredoxin
MPRVTFMLAEGESRSVQAHEGDCVMRVAVEAGIEAIEAICGGGLSCATCHVRVDAAWIDRVPPPTPEELDMLDFTEAPRTDNSRLSCQIMLTGDLDGLVVHVPTMR